MAIYQMGEMEARFADIIWDNAPIASGKLAKLAEEKLGITVDIEYRMGGDDGNNLVRTRIATGEIPDLLAYNSGSLMKMLNPSENFIDFTDDPLVYDRLSETFKQSTGDANGVYGVPLRCAGAGGVLYSRSMYEKYGLEVPETWEDFLANCEVLKENGEIACFGAFGTPWPIVVPVFADNANVLAQEPDFAEKLNAGESWYATTPAALRSFEKLAELYPYYNEDMMAATYDEGCEAIAEGTVGHWFMLTSALATIKDIYGDEAAEDVGFFAVPADNAEDTSLTVWSADGLYGNKNSEKVEDIKRFMEFYISDEAIDAYTQAEAPTGPYEIKGYTLPDTVLKAVSVDMQKYFDEEKTALAMEFMTSLSGNDVGIFDNCTSGLITPEEAAKQYDDELKLSAQQQGYEWAQ